MMRRALALAERGLYTTTPNPRVGCVVTRAGRVLGEGWHEKAGLAHAEALALQGIEATGATVYVTLEPCVMCAGAIVLARVPLVVFGAPDPKAGAIISIAQVFEDRALNHHPRWRMGVMREESERVLKEFFATHRGDG